MYDKTAEDIEGIVTTATQMGKDLESRLQELQQMCKHYYVKLDVYHMDDGEITNTLTKNRH